MKNRLIFMLASILLLFAACATKPPKFAGAPDPSEAQILSPEILPDTVLDIPEDVPSDTQILEDTTNTADELPPENPPEIAMAETVETGSPSEAADDFTLAEPEREIPLPEVTSPPPPVPETDPVEPPPAEIKPAETAVLPEPQPPVEPSGGIWVDTPSYPYITQNSQPEPQPDLTPSRSVTLPMNRFLDIEYPGTGWIYLGENRDEALLAFTSRKLQGSDTLFTLRAKKSGTSILHFYKQDLLNNNYIDDYLEVTVTSEQTSSAAHINAPLYAKTVPPNQDKKTAAVTQTTPTGTPAAQAAQKNEIPEPEPVVPPVITRQPTVIQTTESAPPVSEKNTLASSESGGIQRAGQNTPSASTGMQAQNAAAAPQTRPQAAGTATATPPSQPTINMDNLSPDELLKQAQAALKAGNAKGAHEYLDVFFNKAVGNLDQGLFTRAQVYETKTATQNIRAAIDTYQSLMRQYPSSPLWKQADERVKYLNRFYFNIR